MFVFYSLIFVILLTGILFITIPFIRNKTIFSKSFFIISSFMVIFSLTLYFSLGSSGHLKTWLVKGRKHYELLAQMNHLGGIDGMIIRIHKKLAENPDDAQGWFILGRLYLAKNDQENAEKAFNKVKELKSDILRDDNSMHAAPHQ